MTLNFGYSDFKFDVTTFENRIVQSLLKPVEFFEPMPSVSEEDFSWAYRNFYKYEIERNRSVATYKKSIAREIISDVYQSQKFLEQQRLVKYPSELSAMQLEALAPLIETVNNPSTSNDIRTQTIGSIALHLKTFLNLSGLALKSYRTRVGGLATNPGMAGLIDFLQGMSDSDDDDEVGFL